MELELGKLKLGSLRSAKSLGNMKKGFTKLSVPGKVHSVQNTGILVRGIKFFFFFIFTWLRLPSDNGQHGASTLVTHKHAPKENLGKPKQGDLCTKSSILLYLAWGLRYLLFQLLVTYSGVLYYVLSLRVECLRQSAHRRKHFTDPEKK